MSRDAFESVYVQTAKRLHDTNPAAFEYRLKRAERALRVRRAFFLPPNTPPERLHIHADMWTFAVYFLALCDPVSTRLPDHLSPAAAQWLDDDVVDVIRSHLRGEDTPLGRVFGIVDAQDRSVAAQQNADIPAPLDHRSETNLIDKLLTSLVKKSVVARYSEDTSFLINGDAVLVTDTGQQRVRRALLGVPVSAPAASALKRALLAPLDAYLSLDRLVFEAAAVPCALFDGVQPGETSAYPQQSLEAAVLSALPSSAPIAAEDELAAIDALKAVLRQVAAGDTPYAVGASQSAFAVSPQGVFVSDALWSAVWTLLFGQGVPESLGTVWPGDGARARDRRIVSTQYICKCTGCPARRSVHFRDAYYRATLRAPAQSALFSPLETVSDGNVRDALLPYFDHKCTLKGPKPKIEGDRIVFDHQLLMYVFTQHLFVYAKPSELVLRVRAVFVDDVVEQLNDESDRAMSVTIKRRD